MPTCPQCGAAMDEGAKFCGFCGARPTDAPQATAGSTDETVTLTAQMPPPPPEAPKEEPVSAPAPEPDKAAAPPPKKKSGGKGCLIVVLVFVVGGFLVLVLGGVGGYLYLKKKGASWRDMLHKGQVAAEMQQEQQPFESEAQPQEEQQPSYEEQAQPEQQEAQPEQQPPAEEAQPETQQPVEAATPPASKPAPAKPKPAPKPAEQPKPVPPPAQQQVQPPVEEQQPAPQEEAAAPTKVKKAPFGLIFETSAYVTKLVVKVDGDKVLEQALAPTGSKMRVEKTFVVPEGPHHIRVAMWRAQGEPIKQEWDFTFEHGQNPAFKVELSDNWQPTLKRVQ